MGKTECLPYLNFGKYIHVYRLFDFVKNFNLKKITLKAIRDSYNCREAVCDSCNSWEAVHNSYNCCKVVRDSYNCWEAVRDSYNCWEAVRNSYNCREAVRDNYNCRKKVHGSSLFKRNSFLRKSGKLYLNATFEPPYQTE